MKSVFSRRGRRLVLMLMLSSIVIGSNVSTASEQPHRDYGGGHTIVRADGGSNSGQGDLVATNGRTVVEETVSADGGGNCGEGDLISTGGSDIGRDVVFEDGDGTGCNGG